MSEPIDLVLSRLDAHKVRQNGRDRWRSACPGHGGSNPTALSIGVGDEGQVLLRCWQGCDVEQVISALGLDLSELFPRRQDGRHSGPAVAKRRLISASEALDLLHREMLLAVVCSSDMAKGHALDDATRERLLQSTARVGMLLEESRV